MKTTYPKTVTEKIIEYWGLGFSASETKDALLTEQKINIGLNTIYKHRHSLDGQNLIDQLINKQLRDILSQRKNNPELSMKYRNELLKILIPARLEVQQDINIKEKILQLHMWRPGDADANGERAKEGTAEVSAIP